MTSMFSTSRSFSSPEASYAKPDAAERSCGDWFCIPLFLGNCVFLFWAFRYAVFHGNLHELAGLPNGEGLICGVDEPVAEMPYLYLCPDGDIVDQSDLVCVSQCPVSIDGSLASSSCNQGGGSDYPTIPIANKACFPTETKQSEKMDQLSFRFGITSFLAHMTEVEKAWPVLALSGLATVVCSYFYLTVMSSDPKKLFWTSVGVFSLVYGACGAYAVWQGLQMQLILGDPWGCLSNLEFLIGTAAVLLVVVTNVNIQWDLRDIEAATKAVEASAEAVRDTPGLLLEPLISSARKGFLLMIGFIGLLLFASSYNRSGSEVSDIGYESKHVWIAAGFLLSWSWVFEFSAAVSCFVYGYVAELWIYESWRDDGTKKMRSRLLQEAYWNMVRYHIGSLAFGSLVIMIARPMRMVLDYSTRPIRRDQSGGCMMLYERVPCCTPVCDSAINVYTNYFRGLRKSAFMDMAMRGKGFCDSYKDADWFMEGRNADLSEVDGAAATVALVASFCISAIGVAVTRALCAVWPEYSQMSSPNFILFPMWVSFCSFVINVMISWPFTLMHDHVVDSMYFCFSVETKKYGFGLSEEEREGLSSHPGCNIQSLWSSTAPAVPTVAWQPPKTQAIWTTFKSS